MRNRYRQIIIYGLVVTIGLGGCGSDPPPTEPEGGYLAFRAALLSADSQALWETVTDDTHQIYRDTLADLEAIRESLELLSPSDRAIARERTGVILLARASTAEELFDVLLRLENLVGDEGVRLGSAIDDVTANPAEGTASVLTRAGQTFDLIRSDDGIWRVNTLASVAADRLRSISNNLMAVEVMVSESAYRRRSPQEVHRLLSAGTTEAEPETPEE
jgi:hypothetical protein